MAGVVTALTVDVGVSGHAGMTGASRERVAALAEAVRWYLDPEKGARADTKKSLRHVTRRDT